MSSPVVCNATAAYPATVLNWVNNQVQPAQAQQTIIKYNPHTGEPLCTIAHSQKTDVDQAIALACQTFEAWQAVNIVERGNILRAMAQHLEAHREELAYYCHLETGKSMQDALGEVGAAVEMAYFVAGEGRRFYGKTTTSAVPNRTAQIVRQPVGVCGLIIAANTPVANVAWKVFPALLCGNTAILKASEDTPYTALWMAQALATCGLPAGVLSVIQGLGESAGAPLVEDERVDLVSFTGSVPVGRWIQKVAGERLAKVCLELGGKNALLVCNDVCDDTSGQALNEAVNAAVLSAFSNAGQRCASGSRIIVMDAVYDTFKQKMLEKTRALYLGNQNTDDYGPVINEGQLMQLLAAIDQAQAEGATLLCGGQRVANRMGYYLEPTIFENVSPQALISHSELFGPVTCLYRVASFDEALALANDSPMGLTAAIHTANLHVAQRFAQRVRTGVVSINGPTYGSEPHMPFGGLKASGNGWREAGTEALDVYSDWKTVYTRSYW